MEKLNNYINLLIGSFVGVFIGKSSYTYWFYKKHPDIYLHFSAPWYTDILLYGAISGTIILLLLIAKFFVVRRMKAAEDTDENEK